MIIHVLNFSEIETNVFRDYLEELRETLTSKGVDMGGIVFTFNDKAICDTMRDLIQEHDKGEPLLGDLFFQIAMVENFNEGNKVAIISESLKTEYPWGEAWEMITFIKNKEKANIWHEIAHLLGADDHYERDTTAAKDTCGLDDCIMQYGKLSLVFCEKAINEIKRSLNQNEPELS